MLTKKEKNKLNWKKNKGVLPAIIQNHNSGKILMLGYMRKETLCMTEKSQYVVFYSRKQKTFWKKGHISGNTLKLVEISTDCDYDTLLISVVPQGPTCHLGKESCFDPVKHPNFLWILENTVQKRMRTKAHCSYTFRLYKQGIRRISQKIGEEGVETSLSSIIGDKQSLIEESADLIYHLIIALQYYKIQFSQVIEVLQKRHKPFENL